MAAEIAPPVPAPLNVLVADPLPIYADAVASMLRERGYCAFAATTARAALRLMRMGGADLVLWSVELSPSVPVLRVVQTLRTQTRFLPVIVLGDADTPEVRQAAVRGGANCYMPRTSPLLRVAGAVDQIAEGQVIVLDDLAAPVRAAPQRLQGHRMPDPTIPLSARQLELMQLVASGRENTEIAADLAISDQTVKNHLTDIMRRLGCRNRTEAATYCLYRGWIRYQAPEEVAAS